MTDLRCFSWVSRRKGTKRNWRVCGARSPAGGAGGSGAMLLLRPNAAVPANPWDADEECCLDLPKAPAAAQERSEGAKETFYKAPKVPKLIYTVILWYSFVVRPPPPLPQGDV